MLSRLLRFEPSGFYTWSGRPSSCSFPQQYHLPKEIPKYTYCRTEHPEDLLRLSVHEYSKCKKLLHAQNHQNSYRIHQKSIWANFGQRPIGINQLYLDYLHTPD